MLGSRDIFGTTMAVDHRQMDELVQRVDQCEKSRDRSESNGHDDVREYFLLEIRYGPISSFIWHVNSSTRAGVIDVGYEWDVGRVTAVREHESLINSLIDASLVGHDEVCCSVVLPAGGITDALVHHEGYELVNLFNSEDGLLDVDHYTAMLTARMYILIKLTGLKTCSLFLI